MKQRILIEILQMHERHTHTCTCTHTHMCTQTHTLTHTPTPHHTTQKERWHLKGLVRVNKVIKPHIAFLQQSSFLQTPLFLWEKSETSSLSLLGKILKTHAPSLYPSFFMGWISTMQTPHIFTCLKLLIKGYEKVCIGWTIKKLCYYST